MITFSYIYTNLYTRETCSRTFFAYLWRFSKVFVKKFSRLVFMDKENFVTCCHKARNNGGSILNSIPLDHRIIYIDDRVRFDIFKIINL